MKIKYYSSYVRNPASGLFQIGHKSEQWWLCHNLLAWRQSQFFLLFRVSLVKFSYWSKFHVKMITGSEVITIFVYKGLTRNRKLEIPPSEFCSISGDWGKLGIPNLTRSSLIKSYWILQNARVQLLPFLSY